MLQVYMPPCVSRLYWAQVLQMIDDICDHVKTFYMEICGKNINLYGFFDLLCTCFQHVLLNLFSPWR